MSSRETETTLRAPRENKPTTTRDRYLSHEQTTPTTDRSCETQKKQKRRQAVFVSVAHRPRCLHPPKFEGLQASARQTSRLTITMAAMSNEDFQTAVASAAAAAANAASRQLLQGPPPHWLGAGGQGQAHQQQQLQQQQLQQQQQHLQQQQVLHQQKMRQHMYSPSAQMASRQQPAATQQPMATGAEGNASAAASAAADSSRGLGQLNASLQLLAQQHAAQHAAEAEARRAVEIELQSLREAHELLRLQHGAMSHMSRPWSGSGPGPSPGLGLGLGSGPGPGPGSGVRLGSRRHVETVVRVRRLARRWSCIRGCSWP